MTTTRKNWEVRLYLTPEYDEDPLGVYRIEPIATDLQAQFDAVDWTDEEEQSKLDTIHEANARHAAFIVRACNSYDELLENARALVRFLVENDERWHDNQYVLDMQHAIAHAEGRD